MERFALHADYERIAIVVCWTCSLGLQVKTTRVFGIARFVGVGGSGSNGSRILADLQVQLHVQEFLTGNQLGFL